MRNGIGKIQSKFWVSPRTFFVYLILLSVILISSCTELEKPKTEDFYSDSTPPPKQEFRWSNGKMPKSFDPALASAPPETDIVRAIYDGLTEIDTNTLNATPSIATDWKSLEDNKVWTFNLRKDAKWSNGEKVTARDFVRSWKRLSEMGDKVSHYELLKNIVGLQLETTEPKKSGKDVFLKQKKTEILKDNPNNGLNIPSLKPDLNKPADPNVVPPPPPLPTPVPKKKKEKIGVEAIGDYALKVTLIKPDKDFPKLVAHPILRPVYAAGKEFEDDKLNSKIITNGAFKVAEVSKEGVTLEKAQNYYNKDKVKLDKVYFVPAKDADSALQAYRDGKVDAVTNAKFEPLALKLLTPYYDFRRTTHSALNFYEFNRKNTPFNDRRVREALAISIDRERLTEDELEGATKPALTFLPFKKGENKIKFKQDITKAKELLSKSGFPEGEGFPKIKLVINRNNTQKKVARTVAKMWKQNLNVETEIIEKEFDELEEVKKSGDFDVIRRGIVLPTSDETANMLAIFAPKESSKIKKIIKEEAAKKVNKPTIEENTNTSRKDAETNSTNTSTNSVEADSAKIDEQNPNNSDSELLVDIGDEEIILTEEEAIIEVPAIPLYFPTSYSLVKPYVEGFEMNSLDAPLLKEVKINNNWQPKREGGES